MKMTFNEWQNHLLKQLELDQNKVFNEPKIQYDARIIQKLSRKKTTDLRGIQDNCQAIN
jgi:hypothetical protein